MATCYICGSNKNRSICEIPMGMIVQCLECDTVYRAAIITGEEHSELYQSEAMMETPFYLANKMAVDPKVEPMPTFARGLGRLGELRTPGRLLDIGCSYGAFMVLAQSAGWKTSGVEVSKSAAKFAREERHLDVFTGTLEQAAYPEGYFDAVTLWDVIEHLDDPVSTMAEIHRIMAPGGILLVFTINQESLLTTIGHILYKLSLNRWKHLMGLFYDIHHNFFFSPHTLTSLLKKSELEVTDVQFGAANVHRWRIVPISPLLIFGSDVIDFMSGQGKRRYRMFVYARKTSAGRS